VIDFAEEHIKRPDKQPLAIVQRLIDHHRLAGLAVSRDTDDSVQVFVLCKGFRIQRFAFEVLDDIAWVEWVVHVNIIHQPQSIQNS